VSNITALARPCILRRKAYVPGKPVEEVKRELGLGDIIKMASNENPLGTSPLALQAMIRELQENGNRYPESVPHELSRKVAQLYSVQPEQLFFDNGEDGVIVVLGLTFLNPGEEVLGGEITFSAYENMACKMDATYVGVPLTADYRLDVDAFLARLTPRTKMVFFCNPNNPTGTIITADEFDRLMQGVPDSVLVIMDEAYAEFADDPAFPQAIPYLARYPNLVIMRTFSKLMGLAGLRIGYAIAHPEVIELLLRAHEPFPVNRAAQAGALAALDDPDFVRRTLDTNRQGREQLYAGFAALGLRYYRSQANFVFLDMGRPVEPVYAAMLQQGVIVRPLASFGLGHGLRISVGTAEENARTLAALERALAATAPA